MRRLQHGFNLAARALLDSRNQLESRIVHATAELASKNQQLEVASQAKTRLLAAASHDLRQPLHALTLFSDGLAKGETDPVRLQRIGHIRECVESLDRLFSELLNLSQLDAGVLQPQWTDFALDTLFDEISRNFRAVAEQKNLRLVVRKTEAWVRCDYVMLSRILNNLVSNSLRHTTEGGILVGARRRGKAIRIDVWDTGDRHRGPSPAAGLRGVLPGRAAGPAGRPRVARHGPGPGHRAAARGPAQHPGRPEFPAPQGHLRAGAGARHGARARPAGAARAAVRPPGRRRCRPGDMVVLVIDDERTILEGLQVVLANWGARVMAAQSRAEALALADAWDQPPDIVVSDLLLQGGDNGLDVIAALERHPRGIGPVAPRGCW